MVNMPFKHFLYVFLGFFSVIQAYGQEKVLTMKDAEQLALSNYASIKAKASQLNASKAFLKETKSEYLPDVNLWLSRITEQSMVKTDLLMVTAV